MNPEIAHRLAIMGCRVAGRVPGAGTIADRVLSVDDCRLRSEVAGLSFDSPIGLAAGWDKSGHAIRFIDRLGFGFAEIGSVSARPSIGNPRPRLFRVPEDNAIIVNYGLPNDGARVVAERILRKLSRIPLGANLVATNDGLDAPPATADSIIGDYHESAERLHNHVNYLMLNLSCPNARDGKDFFAQSGNIEHLLRAIKQIDVSCPVFLKIPPSAEPAALDRILEEVDPFGFVKGFMFNLAPGKPSWLNCKTAMTELQTMPGAVAGMPVASQMNHCVWSLFKMMDPKRYAIIGGGGVFTADDAWNQICGGASLVQIYTAFIYHGPMVVREIHRGLVSKMQRYGFSNIADVVGSGL